MDNHFTIFDISSIEFQLSISASSRQKRKRRRPRGIKEPDEKKENRNQNDDRKGNGTQPYGHLTEDVDCNFLLLGGKEEYRKNKYREQKEEYHIPFETIQRMKKIRNL